jgi:peroxiredoxin
MNAFINYRQNFLYFLLLLSAGWIAYTTVQTSKRGEEPYLVPQIGFRAPDFILSDLEGNTYQLNDLKGSAVIINIWASWCKPCETEMPAIQNIYEKYKQENLIILAINNTRQDSIPAVIDFVNKYNLTFPVLLDEDGSVSNAYQVQALPTTFFINPQGIIEEIVVGGPMSEALLDIRVKKIIGEN